MQQNKIKSLHHNGNLLKQIEDARTSQVVSTNCKLPYSTVRVYRLATVDRRSFPVAASVLLHSLPSIYTVLSLAHPWPISATDWRRIAVSPFISRDFVIIFYRLRFRGLCSDLVMFATLKILIWLTDWLNSLKNYWLDRGTLPQSGQVHYIIIHLLLLWKFVKRRSTWPGVVLDRNSDFARYSFWWFDMNKRTMNCMHCVS